MVKARLYPWGSVQGELAELILNALKSAKREQVLHRTLAAELLRYKHDSQLLWASDHVFFFPVENENHCDFVKLREMLLRVNMEDLREQTHARHYELYRRCKLEEMGFKDTDPDSQSFRWI